MCIKNGPSQIIWHSFTNSKINIRFSIIDNVKKFLNWLEPATHFPSQYSTVVLTVVRVMIAKYRKSGILGYRSSLTPEPVELKMHE